MTPEEEDNEQTAEDILQEAIEDLEEAVKE